MEYRPIRETEVPRWREFQEYCFHVDAPDFDGYMQHQFQMEHTRSLFDDNGQMVATLVNLPFVMQVDGGRIPMGGIASVASLPENRRGGHVGELLCRSIREMKEQGTPLSALYPFKQAFYRRYGWEVASTAVVHEIPVELLAQYRKYPGHITRYLRGQWPLEPVAALYERWAPARRGALLRANEAHWRRGIDGWDPKYRAHVALWSPEPGADPEGYLLYRFEKATEHLQAMIVRELVAMNRTAEEALWGFIANHDADVSMVKWRAPQDYPLTHLLADTYPVKSALDHYWELRLVDVKAAFESRMWPKEAEGRFTIGVADEHAPWNQGTWQVTLADGRATLIQAPAEAPDLSASIQTWAQVYASFVRPHAAHRSGRLSGGNTRALALLEKATAGDPFFFFEFF